MVDEINFNIENTIEAIKIKIAEGEKELSGLIQKLKDAKMSNQPIEVIKKITSEVEKATRSLTGLKSTAANTAKILATFSKAFGSDAMKMATNVTSGLTTALKEVGTLGLATASEGFAKFTSPLEESSLLTNLLTANLGSKLTTAMKDYIAVQSTARIALVSYGKNLKDTEADIGNYSQSVREMAAVTGVTKVEYNDFIKVVGAHSPEAFSRFDKAGKSTSDILGLNVTQAAAAMTAFKAFGMSVTEAANEAKRSILEFNQQPLETARRLGVMRRAAEDTGVNTRVAFEQIKNASSSLAIFGQKTDEAASIWRSFTQTLRDTGTPIKHIGEIVSGVTQSMAGMTVQNRAFISMMSGMGKGRSALGGALKMELAMRTPGGMNKAMRGLTEAFSRFAGGKIVTLQEAVDNPQLENSFQVQRKMLEQMGMGKDDNQRARILEALQKVHSGGMSQIDGQNALKEALQKVHSGGMSQIDGQNALKEVFKLGKDVSQKQVDPLQRIDKNMQAAVSKMTSIDSQIKKFNTAILGEMVGGEKEMEALEKEVVTEGGDVSGKLGALIGGIPSNVLKMFGGEGKFEAGPAFEPLKMEEGPGTLGGPGMAGNLAANIQLALQRGELEKLTGLRKPEKPPELKATEKRALGIEALPKLQATRRTGLRTAIMSTAALRQLRENRITSVGGFKNVSDTISAGDSITHGHLKEIIGLSSEIKPTKSEKILIPSEPLKKEESPIIPEAPVPEYEKLSEMFKNVTVSPRVPVPEKVKTMEAIPKTEVKTNVNEISPLLNIPAKEKVEPIPTQSLVEPPKEIGGGISKAFSAFSDQLSAINKTNKIDAIISLVNDSFEGVNDSLKEMIAMYRDNPPQLNEPAANIQATNEVTGTENTFTVKIAGEPGPIKDVITRTIKVAMENYRDENTRAVLGIKV
jgi:hypothetical protein